MNGKNWWSTNPPTEFAYDDNGNLIPNILKVKFKKLHPEATTPSYAKDGDAGLDLTATSMVMTPTTIEYYTGIAVEIPAGYVGLLFPRSSITKAAAGVSLKNSVGVIDSGYRGEIMLVFELPSEPHILDYESSPWRYITKTDPPKELKIPNIGERVGQLLILPYPQIQLDEVEELSSTDRGEGGFGSTGA